MDEDGDGEITVEEFVKGFHKLKQRQNSDGKTVVTAYVRERIKTKDGGGKEAKSEDKPKTSGRRKSLKDPNAVKSLFGGKKASTENAAPPNKEAAKT